MVLVQLMWACPTALVTPLLVLLRQGPQQLFETILKLCSNITVLQKHVSVHHFLQCAVAGSDVSAGCPFLLHVLSCNFLYQKEVLYCRMSVPWSRSNNDH